MSQTSSQLMSCSCSCAVVPSKKRLSHCLCRFDVSRGARKNSGGVHSVRFACRAQTLGNQIVSFKPQHGLLQIHRANGALCCRDALVATCCRQFEFSNAKRSLTHHISLPRRQNGIARSIGAAFITPRRRWRNSIVLKCRRTVSYSTKTQQYRTR